jgi:hypothetical protein
MTLVQKNFGIPRPFGDTQERVPVNLRRGMFRLWLVISSAWVMGWTIYLLLEGLDGAPMNTGNWLSLPVLLFGPPIALLLFGTAVGWAFRGFKDDDTSPQK